MVISSFSAYVRKALKERLALLVTFLLGLLSSGRLREGDACFVDVGSGTVRQFTVRSGRVRLRMGWLGYASQSQEGCVVVSSF